MTWDIVLGLIALLGAGITVGTQVAKLSRTLALLESAVKELKGLLAEFKSSNREEHKELRAHLEETDGRLLKLETEFRLMEEPTERRSYGNLSS